MGKNGCNKVGVTIKNLLNQEPTTTNTPAMNAGKGFLPFLNNNIKIGINMAVKIANQNIGANSPVNKPNKCSSSDFFILNAGTKNSFTLKYK